MGGVYGICVQSWSRGLSLSVHHTATSENKNTLLYLDVNLVLQYQCLIRNLHRLSMTATYIHVLVRYVRSCDGTKQTYSIRLYRMTIVHPLLIEQSILVCLMNLTLYLPHFICVKLYKLIENIFIYKLFCNKGGGGW